MLRVLLISSIDKAGFYFDRFIELSTHQSCVAIGEFVFNLTMKCTCDHFADPENIGNICCDPAELISRSFGFGQRPHKISVLTMQVKQPNMRRLSCR